MLNSRDRQFQSGAFACAVVTVDVLIVELKGSQRIRQSLAAALPDADLKRTARYAHAVLRERHLLYKGLQRVLLASYARSTPEALQFSTGAWGKPCLANSDVRFNSSHSNDLAAFAFTRDVEVGIDIERIRPFPDLETVAAQFFHASEHAALLADNPCVRLSKFYRMWTRKEAALKATGTGLLGGLAFPVNADSEDRCGQVTIDGESASPRTLFLTDLEIQHGFAGSLAAESPCAVRLRQFSSADECCAALRARELLWLNEEPAAARVSTA